MKRVLVASAFTILVGCGGDGAFGPGAGNDPGGGTGTLLVSGDVEAGPAFDNAQDELDFTTSFRIRVERGGAPVTTGTVTVESIAGAVDLVFDPSDEGGRWRGVQSGYYEVYRLDVASGEDAVEGVRVDGPDIHWFDAPLAGASVDASLPLDIEWDRGDEAESASLETEQIDRVGIADTGAYTLAVGSLRSKAAETETERIDLRRSARVVPAGGIGGSELSVQIENRIDVVVAPCPTCHN
jgi:hypothetical protein